MREQGNLVDAVGHTFTLTLGFRSRIYREINDLEKQKL